MTRFLLGMMLGFSAMWLVLMMREILIMLLQGGAWYMLEILAW